MTRSVLHKDRDERVVFINAWNEWAEGMYLEPDAKFGHGYLNAVALVLGDRSFIPKVSADRGSLALSRRSDPIALTE